ncbi:MAG: AAA family ATPase, partial [Candidatus Paceibacterota bacterium]
MKKGIYAWASIIVWLGQYFSIKPLFKTLFVPWHRDQVSATELGLLMRIVLGILIRLIGAVVRLGIIILGLFTIFLFALTLPIFILPLSINVKRLSHRRPLGRDLAFRFTPLLNRFTRDMSYGPETVLIGKEDTYKRLEQVLARGKQNNALLVGEPGMGRTTLLEQLAKRISWGETLPALSYRHVFEVDLEGLTGEVLTKFLTEASLAGNVILVFDNIHNHPEVLDSILPFTDQSNMQIVGVTTVAGYHTVLKNRTDLLQRFEKVDMAEPTDIEVVNLVQATIRSQGVVAEDGVAEEIVKLTNKLVFNVPQPEKSLDIVEELVIGGTKEINIQDVQDLLTAKTGTPAGGI